MKLSLLAVALIALALSACGRPNQPAPENSTTYGTRTEEGSTMAEERAAAGKTDEHAADQTAPDHAAAADGEDEYSGKAVLPGHALDGNGNPLKEGESPIPAAH